MRIYFFVYFQLIHGLDKKRNAQSLSSLVGRQRWVFVLSHLRVYLVIVFHFIDRGNGALTDSMVYCSAALIM